MISVLDDYCAHQVPGYLSVPGITDRNFYDRYFFNGYLKNGEIAFGIAFGRYPNRLVKDAHFTVVIDGVQHSLHASDEASAVELNSSVGPMSVDILQPMRTLHCHGNDTEHRISYDLIFHAETGVINEGPLIWGRKGIVYHNATRFMQYGSWRGWIEVDGLRHEIREGEAYGLRDKSWGVRPFAEQLATQRADDQLFWMNVVIRLSDKFCVIRTVEDAVGEHHDHDGYLAPLYESGASVPVGETSLDYVKNWEFKLKFAGDTRRVIEGVYTLNWADGAATEFEGRVLNTFWYSGMGYNHPRWNHGLDHGGLAVERESWDISQIDLTQPEGQFMCAVLEISQNGKIVGFGHTEHLFIGPYAPLGWGETGHVDI